MYSVAIFRKMIVFVMIMPLQYFLNLGAVRPVPAWGLEWEVCRKSRFLLCNGFVRLLL